MGFFDNMVSAGANMALNTVVRGMFNMRLSGILEIKEIRIPYITFSLEGIPEREFKAEVGSIKISDDGEKVMLSDFRSETPFVENALNRFVPKVIEVSDSKVQMALRGVSKIL